MPHKTNTRKPTRTNLSVLAQLCKLIPPYLVSKVARQYGVDKKARTFSPWSHLVALLYAQFTHSLSLNDVCDALKHHAPKLSRVRNATPPVKKRPLSRQSRARRGHGRGPVLGDRKPSYRPVSAVRRPDVYGYAAPF